jgi:hypothetical protein
MCVGRAVRRCVRACGCVQVIGPSSPMRAVTTSRRVGLLYHHAGTRPPRPSRGVRIRLTSGDEVTVPRKHLELVPPDHPLSPEPDGTQAAWWLEQLEPWGEHDLSVSSLVPSGLPAVCQVLHPWWGTDAEPISWRSAASQLGFASVTDFDRSREMLHPGRAGCRPVRILWRARHQRCRCAPRQPDERHDVPRRRLRRGLGRLGRCPCPALPRRRAARHAGSRPLPASRTAEGRAQLGGGVEHRPTRSRTVVARRPSLVRRDQDRVRVDVRRGRSDADGEPAHRRTARGGCHGVPRCGQPCCRATVTGG